MKLKCYSCGYLIVLSCYDKDSQKVECPKCSKQWTLVRDGNEFALEESVL